MSLKLALILGASIFRNGASARALPQVQPIVISNGVGANAAAGAAATVAGGVGGPALPTVPSPTNGAQVGVPVPVVSFSTSTASVEGDPSPTIKPPSFSSASIPAISAPISPSIPTAPPLLPPVPLSPGPLSPIIDGTLNAPIIQNTDLGALTTLLSINAPVIGGVYGISALPSLPTGTGLPTGDLPVATGIGGLTGAASSIPVASGIISTLSNSLFGLIEAILPNQAGNVISGATSAASIPAISALPTPALPGLPNIPAPLAPPVQLAGGSNVPTVPLPASSLLSVTNASALTAHFSTLSPRSPQLGAITGPLVTSVKAPAALPTGAVSLPGLAGPLPTAALPGVATALPSLPAAAPSLPAGVPPVPLGALSLPAAVPSIPAVAHSLPAGVPSVPSGLPSLPAGEPALSAGVPSLPAGIPPLPTGVPSLPAGIPPLPTGVPSLPAGVPPLPTGVPPLPTGVPPLPTGVPSLPIGVLSVPSGVPSLPSGVAPPLPTGVLTGIPVPSGALPSVPTNVAGSLPSLNISTPVPVLPTLSLPVTALGTGVSIPVVGTLVPPNLPISAPVPAGPLPTGSLIPEGYGGGLPLPPQLASVDTAIGAATEKLGENEPLSDQTDTLLGLLSVLGTENPATYGSLASLSDLGALEGAASSLNPADLNAVNELFRTLQISPTQFLFNAVDFVKTIEELASLVNDLAGSVSYLVLGALALS